MDSTNACWRRTWFSDSRLDKFDSNLGSQRIDNKWQFIMVDIFVRMIIAWQPFNSVLKLLCFQLCFFCLFQSFLILFLNFCEPSLELFNLLLQLFYLTLCFQKLKSIICHNMCAHNFRTSSFNWWLSLLSQFTCNLAHKICLIRSTYCIESWPHCHTSRV